MIFRNWVLQNFPYIEDDFDALTDYELFCKICGYVLKYSKDNEEMKKKIEEFQHYFDNLDVQEEINNKLDEMAESGELAEIINEEIFEGLNTKINFNKSHNLADSVQAFPADIDISSTFPDDYSITGFVITTINSVPTGVVVANDWSSGGSGGNKFSIKTFTYVDGVIANITLKQALIDGHSNGFCLIDETHCLIVGMSHNYIYDIENDDITEITSYIPYCRSCAEYNGRVFVATDYDHDLDIEVNAMYEIDFSNNYVPSVIHTYTLPNMYEKIKMQNQGMVIYEDLIIFPTFNDCRLVIYDFNTLEYLKTQVFTAPYLVEYENGFVYNGKLYMNDGLGKVFIPDLYCQHTYGDYNKNVIAKSLTDVCMYDDIIKLDNTTSTVTINFTKYLSFNQKPDTDYGVLGRVFDSLTIYCGLKIASNSNRIYNLVPIEIPCYKEFTYESQTEDWLSKNFETHFIEWQDDNNRFIKYTICGTYWFGGGSSVPNMQITITPYILQESFATDGTQAVYINTSPEYSPELYISKIIGHRKVGLKY